MASDRNIRARVKGLGASAAALAVCAGTAASVGQVTWVGGFSQSWHDHQNWNTQMLPGPNDAVFIPNTPGSVDIGIGATIDVLSIDCHSTLNNGGLLRVVAPSYVNNVILGGLRADAPFTLDGPGLLGGGSLIFGTGPFINTGLLTALGDHPTVQETELRNEGTLRVEGNLGLVANAAPALLKNTGVIELRSGSLAGGTDVIVNTGTGSVVKPTADGFSLSGFLQESGSFAVQAGSLWMGSSAWKGGSFTIGAGAHALVSPAHHEWDGLPAITGTGVFEVACSAISPSHIKKNLTFNMQAPGKAWWSGGGLLVGDATVTNAGELLWSYTGFGRLPGTTQGKIVNSGHAVIPQTSPGAGTYLDLINTGTVEQHSSLGLFDDAKAVNTTTWILRKGEIGGGLDTRFVNTGTLIHPADSHESLAVISVALDMDGGRIEAPAGAPPGADLLLSRGGDWTNGSELIVGAGREVQVLGLFRPGAGAPTELTGPGTVRVGPYCTAVQGFRVQPGAQMTAALGAGGVVVTGGLEVLCAGIIDGPGLTRNVARMIAHDAFLGQNENGNLENTGELVIGIPGGPAGGTGVSGTLANAPAGRVTQSQHLNLWEGMVVNAGMWTTEAGTTTQPGALFRNLGGGVYTATNQAPVVQGPFDNQGLVEVESDVTLTFLGPITQFVNGELLGGQWLVHDAGALVLPGAITRIGAGTLLVGSGAGVPALAGVRHVSGGVLELNGDLTITEPTATLTLDNGGAVTVGHGATLSLPGTITVAPATPVPSALSGGFVPGDGPSESFVVAPLVANGGAVVPGGDDEPGILDLTGAYKQSAAGELWIEIGGLTPGMQHDVFEVSGQAALAGKLKVALIDGYTPASGAEFTILTAASVLGTFDTLDLPALPAGREWEVLYAPGGEQWVTLRVTDSCYPDCNQSGSLTVADFGCFQTKFVGGDPYADCTQGGGLTVADFGCFQTKFVAGCP